MNIWKIIYLGMLLVGTGIAIGNHGKPKDGYYSAWLSILGAAIDITVLALGGFFN